MSFVWNCCRREFLWFINTPWGLNAWGKSCPHVIVEKCLLANEISVFFNHQYFFNRSSSDFDIWHVDRHEWKEQGLLTGFLKKILIVANKPFMAQKMVHPHNSGPAVRIFLNFFTIIGDSRYMKIMFITFSKEKIALELL